MRLLLVNYRYFLSGGPERYMFNVKELLERKGHEVVPFSLTYDRNEPSEYADYFAPPLSDPSEVYFRDQRRTVTAYARSLERAFYSPVVYRRLARLIDATNPDAALVLHYLRKLSPSVLKCLDDKGVPFAVRLSDFAMICANAHLLRGTETCELCVRGDWRHSVRYACIQGSRTASAVNYAATSFHKMAGYYERIRKFIVPSRFLQAKMVEGGWPEDRFVHIPTFVEAAANGSPPKSRHPTVVYVGRLEPHKGLDVLIDAVRQLEVDGAPQGLEVRIVGDGEPEFVAYLRDRVAAQGLRSVRFEGVRSAAEIRPMLSAAWCSVVPSLWYENMPNSALESMACGTGVVASEHGSLPEVVKQNRTGWLVKPGNAEELRHALRNVIADPEGSWRLGQQARDLVGTVHSPEAHYERLMETFSGLGAPC